MKQHSKNGMLPGTRAIVRAFQVLRALGASSEGQGVTALAETTGLSKASVFRALSALHAEDMVAQPVVNGPYRLGPGLIALGSSALSTMDLRTIARDDLVALTELTGENATLEVMLDFETLILDEVQGRYLLGSTPEIGRRWPAHATSTGKLLLALGDKREIPSTLQKCAPKTITSRAGLEAQLARIRKHGYATAVDELEPGFVAVAAPVRNHTGAVIAALSINGPKIRLNPSERRALIDPLCAAANRVSQRLGAKESFTVAGTSVAVKTKTRGVSMNAHA